MRAFVYIRVNEKNAGGGLKLLFGFRKEMSQSSYVMN